MMMPLGDVSMVTVAPALLYYTYSYDDIIVEQLGLRC